MLSIKNSLFLSYRETGKGLLFQARHLSGVFREEVLSHRPVSECLKQGLLFAF